MTVSLVVFREAQKMLENERFDIVVGDEKLALNPGLKRVAPDVPDPEHHAFV
ncbi:hypothetical protein N5V81_14240 [Escherichia coli]|nr:hypothetical protein [Escherichia coli]